MTEDREKQKKIDMLKKAKTVKTLIGIIGGSAPLVMVLCIVCMAAIAALLPIFTMTTTVGGETVYGNSASDLPSDLTVQGIDTWTEEERMIFDKLEEEKKYYDNDFKYYNASTILADKNEELDVSTPISTTNYQGTVNLLTYDEEYLETIFSDGSSSLEYKDEKNVKNSNTRDFYKKAGKRIGNTFMMYPSKRMLLGYLIANNVSFYTVEYEEWVCDSGICNNSSEIYSDWSYLGKITASNESDAKKGYSPTSAVENVEDAIKGGRYGCQNDKDEWLKDNYCYDTDMLFEEIFGEEVSGDIITYLVETYEAQFPRGDFHVGTEYIAVDVSKEINYDLYSRYLKDIYIPYIYINCDSCGYKDESDELKKSQINKIHDEIINLTNSFKKYNNEDELFVETDASIGGGTADIPGINYNCSSGQPHLATYKGHSGIDINGVPEGTYVYPLFEGVVTNISRYNYNCYPRGNDSTGYTCGHCTSGYGNMVVVKGKAADGNEYYAMYAHLSEIMVSEGQKITLNTVIGKMGNTGCSTGPHLHLELREDYYSKSTIVYANSIYSNNSISSLLCSRTEG